MKIKLAQQSPPSDNPSPRNNPHTRKSLRHVSFVSPYTSLPFHLRTFHASLSAVQQTWNRSSSATRLKRSTSDIVSDATNISSGACTSDPLSRGWLFFSLRTKLTKRFRRYRLLIHGPSRHIIRPCMRDRIWYMDGTRCRSGVMVFTGKGGCMKTWRWRKVLTEVVSVYRSRWRERVPRIRVTWSFGNISDCFSVSSLSQFVGHLVVQIFSSAKLVPVESSYWIGFCSFYSFWLYFDLGSAVCSEKVGIWIDTGIEVSN